MGQASLSRSSKSSTLLNKFGEEALSEGIFQTIESRDVHVLLPIGSESVSAVQARRGELSSKVDFALPPTESLILALDKSKTIERSKELGIESPDTWIFSNLESLKAGIFQLNLPLVIKSSSELAKFGPHYLFSKSDIESLLSRFDLSETFLSTGMIVQSIIRGPGVGFFALYQDGSCKRMFMHQRLRETPSSGGSSWAAKGIRNPELAKSGLRLLDSLDWHGPAMVEFKLDQISGRPSLMELNPKFWGSLDLAIESGVDFPSDTVRVAVGESLKPDFAFESGKFFVWPLEEPYRYLLDKDLHNSSYRTNIKLSDPAPALYQAFQGLALNLLRKSKLLSNLLLWASRYSFDGFKGRFVGQILGIPTKRHCQINDKIWVGAKPTQLGEILLRGRGFTSRASLIEEQAPKKKGILNVQALPLDEFVSIPTIRLWEYTDLLLSILEDSQSRVFIHCREGVGRAPAVAVAVLMRQGRDLAESLELVQKGRRVAKLNLMQINSLKLFAKQISENRRS